MLKNTLHDIRKLSSIVSLKELEHLSDANDIAKKMYYYKDVKKLKKGVY